MKLSDNMRGAAYMVGSMTAFATNDAFMKLVTRELPLAQAVVLRGAAATLLIGALALWYGAFRAKASRRDWGLIALRTLTEIGMTWTFLRALADMPLANLHAILQALPLTVTLGAALVLGEHIGWRRMAAILVGFVGVMLIIRPGPEGFTPAALNGIASVGFITARDLISRRLSPAVSSLAVSFITALVVTLSFAATGSFASWMPVGPQTGAFVFAAAVAIFFGYLFSVMTMRVGEIGFVSPFRYSGLLAALVLGWALFGDWPDAITFLGGAIVVGTGLFTLYRERAGRAARG